MTETLIGPARGDPAGTPPGRPGHAAAIPRQRGTEPAPTDSPTGPVSAGQVRIAICNWRDLTHPEGGGSELYVEQVARALARLGNEVTVLCANVDGAPADESRGGVHYRRRGGRFTVYLHAAAALLTRRVAADVVVDVQNGLPWLSRLVTRRPVVVLVHHVHREQWPIAVGRIGGRIGWWVESRIGPRLYRRSRYVAVSKATRADLARIGVAPGRVRLAHNGTPAVRQGDLQRSPTPRIVVLGRLVPHKRVELVIDALAALRDRHRDLVLDVVGQGWWHDRLAEHARRRGVTDRVVFHGFVDEQRKADLLGQAWVNAVPSLKEGWALSVVEAASRRTPSIAFAGAGGLDESIVDGSTGVLVDGDGAAFTAALDRLLSDTSLREALGAAAEIWARQFTWAATAERWTELLDGTVAAIR